MSTFYINFAEKDNAKKFSWKWYNSFHLYIIINMRGTNVNSLIVKDHSTNFSIRSFICNNIIILLLNHKTNCQMEMHQSNLSSIILKTFKCFCKQRILKQSRKLFKVRIPLIITKWIYIINWFMQNK